MYEMVVSFIELLKYQAGTLAKRKNPKPIGALCRIERYFERYYPTQFTPHRATPPVNLNRFT
jgi:hypothetical protein